MKGWFCEQESRSDELSNRQMAILVSLHLSYHLENMLTMIWLNRAIVPSESGLRGVALEGVWFLKYF